MTNKVMCVRVSIHMYTHICIYTYRMTNNEIVHGWLLENHIC